MNKAVIVAFAVGIIVGYLLFTIAGAPQRYKFWVAGQGAGYKIDVWTGRVWGCYPDECQEITEAR